MKYRTAVLYGLGVWAFVFAVSVAAYALHDEQRPLFESIMPVTLAAAVTYAALAYFRKTPQATLAAGLRLGLIWLGVNVAIDSLMFSWGPMQMSVVEYFKDIGLTYLMMPIITAGIGRAYDRRDVKHGEPAAQA